MSRHDYEENITCPWCDYEHQDVWGFGESGLIECYVCGREFEFEQDAKVTYSSWKPPVLIRKADPKAQQGKDKNNGK